MRSTRALSATVAILTAACGSGSDTPTTPTLIPAAPGPVSAPVPAPAPTPVASSLDVCAAIGAAPAPTFTIINGRSCGVSASSVVQVVLRYLDGGAGLCTGTAIADKAVLSAAHCLTAGVEAVRVIAAGRTVTVASNHPVASYGEDDEGSLDVGVVLTTQSLGVPPVPMLTSRSASTGERGVIAGYGLDNAGGDGALKAGSMTVASVNANFIVADFSGVGSNTCSGDSGGPFLLQQAGEWVLGGVTSGGSGDPTCQVAGTSDFANLRNPEAIALVVSVVPAVMQR